MRKLIGTGLASDSVPYSKIWLIKQILRMKSNTVNVEIRNVFESINIIGNSSLLRYLPPTIIFGYFL